MPIEKLLTCLILMLGIASSRVLGDLLPGFERSPWFGEQTREERAVTGIRMVLSVPCEIRADKPTTVTYKKGGATVAVLTLSYTGSDIASVVRS